MLRSTIPHVISEYGIQSGGCHVEPVRYHSMIASCSKVHDFQEKETQNISVTMSTKNSRMRLARGDIIAETASIATWPRRACTAAADMKTAPTIRKTENSSCQSVEKWKK